MVSSLKSVIRGGPELSAPARFAFLAALLCLSLPLQPTKAQQRQGGGPSAPAAAPPAASPSVPDQATVAKLVWTTMAALDHANSTSNYSVFRELGSPAFQASNTPASLAATFAPLRAKRLDLSSTLLLEPTYDFEPRLENGLLRARGAFRSRPAIVQFDLLFQWAGAWRLFGIAVAPAPMAR